MDVKDSREQLNKTPEGPEAAQTSRENGPSGDVLTVRASLFENVVERRSVLMVDDGKPANKAKDSLSKSTADDDEGTLVTATYKAPVSPSSPLRVSHAFDTVQAVEESRAVSENIPSAQREDKAMTLRTRRSEGNQPAAERTTTTHGEPEQQPRYLRVGALQKWSNTGLQQEDKGMVKATWREVASDEDEERQRDAEQEEVAAAPKRLKMVQTAEEQLKPRATYFALTGQIQDPSPVDAAGSTGVYDEFSVRPAGGSSQGKIVPPKRNPSLHEAFAKNSQDQVEELMRSNMSHRDGQTAEETMEVGKKREDRHRQSIMKELEREKWRQLEMEKERLLEFERMKEREMQRDFERQRQKAFEKEKQELEEKQRALERQKLIELEKQKLQELERKRLERERQQQLEAEKQRELERQRRIEREKQQEQERKRQRELERQRQREEERQRELDKERQLLEIQERQRMEELERQQLLEFQKQKQREKERQQILELERQKLREKKEREEAERLKQMALEQEMLRLKELDKERERQREMERERLKEMEREKQKELERQRLRDLERERQKQLEIQRQELENQRLRQQELERERQKREEMERIKEMERRQLMEFEKQKQAERERQQILELEKRRIKEREEAERMRQMAKHQEAERQRLRERQKKEEQERARLEASPLRPKVLDLDSVLRSDSFTKSTPQRGDPSTRWREPSLRAEESYRPSILDIDSFTAQASPSPSRDLFPVSGFQGSDSGSGARLQPAPEREISWKVPPQTPPQTQTSLGFTAPVWTMSPQDPWELQSVEMSVDTPLPEPSKQAPRLRPEQLLLRHEERVQTPQRPWSAVLDEQLRLAPPLLPAPDARTGGSAGGATSNAAAEQIWIPREPPQPQDSRGEVRGHRRSHGSQVSHR